MPPPTNAGWSFCHSPSYESPFPKNPYVARKDLAKAAMAMGGMAGATARD